MRQTIIENPYRPGAGHAPPFLAGRHAESDQFKRLLEQPVITENILITGLRGFGKTVLLDRLRSMAENDGWLWVGNDLSESSALSEERLALRILTDIAQAVAVRIDNELPRPASIGLRRRLEAAATESGDPLTFEALKTLYERAPGLPSDRLRAVMQRLTAVLDRWQIRGLILGYDEAQCLSDHAGRNEFPMSMLIETVSALQKSYGLTPCLLVLSGLPQVFDALVATRTYTERMFQVMTLERLSRDEVRAALTIPLSHLAKRLHTPPDLIEKAVELTGGYPYLVQFFGRELVDQLLANGGTLSADAFPEPDAFARLDAGLFSARWNRTSDRQRELLGLIASRLQPGAREFSTRSIEALRDGPPDGDTLNVSQLLTGLCDRDLLYRTRHGHYAFTIPMSDEMILRRTRQAQNVAAGWETKRVTMPEATAKPSVRPQPQKKGWFRSK